MTNLASNWIPSSRIRLAVTAAGALALAAAFGAFVSLWFLALLAPALVSAWIAFVLTSIRRQLSDGGGGWQRRVHELVISHLEAPGDAAVLDIGCGDASLLAELVATAPGVGATGVDFWGATWDYAKAACEARLPAASFHRMDAAHLDFEGAAFDAVVSVMCFHEVRTPAGCATSGPILALGEALRVLRPGGQFVLVDRFDDAADFDPAALASLLGSVTEVHREPLVTALAMPWPLSTRRAMGPTEVLWGRK